MRTALRVAVPAVLLAWLLVPSAVGRPPWLDRALGRERAGTPPGEALGEQVAEAFRSRFGRPLGARDAIHVLARPQPLGTRGGVPPLAELEGLSDKIPDAGPVWKPLGGAQGAYGTVLRSVDLGRVYGGVASLREPLARIDAARQRIPGTGAPAPERAQALRENLERLQRAVAAEQGRRDERFQETAPRYAAAWDRYLRPAGGDTAVEAAPLRPYRLDPPPLEWQKGGPRILLSAAVPASSPPEGGASIAERIAATSEKRIGVVNVEPGEWFDGEALRFIAANDLLPDAAATWRRVLPRMPVMLVVASDPTLEIRLEGVRPEDVEGGSVHVEGMPQEARGTFRIETAGNAASLVYEPATLYLVGVVSSEVHRP